MLCHECLRTGVKTPAIGTCRFCQVGLCKPHLVASFHPRNFPQYACDRHPERSFAPANGLVSTAGRGA
jgi:Uncharacterized protein conserved in archaea (DUF2180).